MTELSIISEKMAELDDEGLNRVIRQALRVGVPAADIIDAAVRGMDEVGRSFEIGEYSICDLIMAGTIFDNILNTEGLEAGVCYKENGDSDYYSGRILLGTVAGDIHDIGKNFFRSMVSSVGFKVIDLGVDVSPEAFHQAARQYKPDIIALSASLVNRVDSIQETVDLLKRDPETADIYLLLGGRYAKTGGRKPDGVDGVAYSSKDSVNLCIQFKNRKGEPPHAES